MIFIHPGRQVNCGNAGLKSNFDAYNWCFVSLAV